VIPDKIYFRIGEVSRLLRTKPFVLRYWETEFSNLKPEKSRSGHRLYRRKDIETVLQIRRLLYEEGYTIEGARKRLAALSRKREQQKSLFHVVPDGTELRSLKRELEGVLTILSRKC
jgi:DNA-binding transcriptional MerR regulator